MKKVLVVEDTSFFASIIKTKLETALGLDVTVARDMKQAMEFADTVKDDYLALLDLNLPDAPNGEIVPYFTQQKIPSIVFTGTYNEQKRDQILSSGAIDYIVKDNPASFDYLISLVQRVIKNQHIKVMVVDDSRVSRHLIGDICRRFQLSVVEAANGKEALKLIKEHGLDIRLIITDYSMPEMDGFELIRQLRGKYTKNQMAIIGLSASSQKGITSKFIKNGANDFLQKPFETEEFLVRVQQNLDQLDHVEELEFAATRDFLTGLYNRRYFFMNAIETVTQCHKKKKPLTAIMFDIDKFKSVNDTYGHDAGDIVLKAFAAHLQEHITENDLLARLGGEEFAILSLDNDLKLLEKRLKKMLQSIANATIDIPEYQLKITTSIGISCIQSGSIDQMLNDADEMLYLAKENGRNRAYIHTAKDKDPLIITG